MKARVSWMLDLVLEGLRSLQRYRVRSLLAMLGVVFGVAAVIAMQGIGTGAQQTVLKEISGLGLRNIILDSVKPQQSALESSSQSHGLRVLRYGVTDLDVRRLRAALPQARLAVGHQVNANVRNGSRRLDAGVLGVEAGYFDLFQSQVLSGRLLTETDNREAFRVAVVSEAVMESLGTAGGRLPGSVSIGTHLFRVVGVVRLPSPGDTRRIYIPYRTAKALYGTMTMKLDTGGGEFTRTEVGRLVIQMPSDAQVPSAAAMIEGHIKRDHNQPDVELSVPLDLLRSKQRTQQVFNLVLLCVAAISLLVGGIGIMNIMLAIVTERTREIGLRRAIGARRRDILFQFLAETITLSGCGGILGCLLGMQAIPLAARVTGWPGVITAWSVILSLGVSLCVGLVFGLAPAIRAACMDPVTALRHE